MNWNDLIYEMQDLHFRKVFLLATFIVAGILLLLKHWLLPNINRRENMAHRIIRRTLDICILIDFALIAVAAITF